jgi:hypothetical protein
MAAELERETRLDRAIDDLIANGTWDVSHEGTDDADELGRLMDVASQVLELARRTGGPNNGQKQAVWLRLDGMLKRWSGANFLASAVRTPVLMRWTNTERRECGPPREVVFEN